MFMKDEIFYSELKIQVGDFSNKKFFIYTKSPKKVLVNLVRNT